MYPMPNVQPISGQVTSAIMQVATATPPMVVVEDHTGALLMLNVRQRMVQATLAITTVVHASTLVGMVGVKKVQSMLSTIVRMDHGRLAKYARMELGSRNHRPAHNALMATGRLSTTVPTERRGRLATCARAGLGSRNHRPAHNALSAKPRIRSIAQTEQHGRPRRHARMEPGCRKITRNPALNAGLKTRLRSSRTVRTEQRGRVAKYARMELGLEKQTRNLVPNAGLKARE